MCVQNIVTAKSKDDRRAGTGQFSVTAAGLCGLKGSPKHRRKIIEYAPPPTPERQHFVLTVLSGEHSVAARCHVCTEKYSAHTCRHAQMHMKTGNTRTK